MRSFCCKMLLFFFEELQINTLGKLFFYSNPNILIINQYGEIISSFDYRNFSELLFWVEPMKFTNSWNLGN